MMRLSVATLLAILVTAFGCKSDASPFASTGDASAEVFRGERDCSGGPRASPIADCTPKMVAQSGDHGADCVYRINQLRWECQCLPPLVRWKDAEVCAAAHATYDADGNGPHAGFENELCSPSGVGQNECPAWSSTREILGGCLQLMWDEGPGEDFEKHGHYLNMSNRAFTEVACGFATDENGGRWSVQNFR